MSLPKKLRNGSSAPRGKRTKKIPRPNLTPEFQFVERQNVLDLLRLHYERTNNLHPVITAKINGVKVGRLIYTLEIKQRKYRYWKLDLDVNEEYRRLGVAQFLVMQLIQHAQEHNKRTPEERINALVADIDANDKTSIALAYRLHFTQTGINYHGDRTAENTTLIFQYQL